MKKYILEFTGRHNGAIGIFHTIQACVFADSLENAKLALYDDYEHLKGVTEIGEASIKTNLMSLNSILRLNNIKTIGRYTHPESDVKLEYNGKIIPRPTTAKCKEVVKREFGISL